MRQLTNEARAEQTRLLCLAKRKKPIGQILNVNILKSCQELPDRELHFVFRLLQGEYSLTQIKILCLLRWGQLKVVRREGAVFIVRHNKKNYPLTTLQICVSTEALAWLGDFPQYPVRLSRIGIYRPVRADFQNVSFGDFLALDNLYQGYLQNLTPASRQRVFDLRERLCREKSDARDALMQELNTCGLSAPHNLLWNATLCRKYGIRTKDGSQVYEEELQLVKTDIDAAQGKCAFIVSEEQMAELIAMQETMFYQDLIQLCRHFMAAYVKDDVNAIRTMMHRLQHYLNENADALSTYKSSSKYEADHFTPYENKIEDSCFFFG